MQPALLSITIPTRNRPGLLERALTSWPRGTGTSGTHRSRVWART
jgi:hypothetical protein